MRSLFLGLGKVNRSIAAHIEGELIALVEGERALEVWVRPDGKRDWILREEVEGDLDSFEWKRVVPARIYISPGIDPRRPFFEKIQKFEVRELDYFFSHFKGQTICVTGTDGKSTFTTQLGEVLKRALPDKKVFTGGNLGIAMCDALTTSYDLAVLEVSSFQCERLKVARPNVGILLNLDTDHLDRYNKLSDYEEAKWTMLERCEHLFFPESKQGERGVKSLASFSNQEELATILRKVVNKLAGLLNFEVREDLFRNLPTLPHRMQRVERNGRVFINDSKATTVHSSLYGLLRAQAEFSSVSLILGGKYKGDDFTRYCPVLRKADRVLICGEAREIIGNQLLKFEGEKTVFATLRECLEKEIPRLKGGECLLLSPACSSYDEFDNFEERGNLFLDLVQKL